MTARCWPLRLLTGTAPQSGCLIGAFGSVEQWADLGDELAEADRADAGERFEQLRFRMLVECRGAIARSRSAIVASRVRTSRACAWTSSPTTSGSSVLTGCGAWRRRASSSAGLRGRIAVKEVERDLAVESAEDRGGSGPVRSEQRRQLERAGDPSLAVREAEALDHRSLLVDDAKLVRFARPVDPNEHLLTSLIGDTYLGAEGPKPVAHSLAVYAAYP